MILVSGTKFTVEQMVPWENVLTDLAMVLVGLVDMGLKTDGVVLEQEQEDTGLLELVVVDSDTGLFLELAEGALADSLTRLDLATKSGE